MEKEGWACRVWTERRRTVELARLGDLAELIL
jgi:hypothetical protein